MSVSSQTLRCFSPLSSSSSSNHQWRRSASIRCSPSPSLQEPLIPPRIELHKPLPPSPNEDNPSNTSGIQVPRQRYISVSKSELLDAIASSMFPSPEEATQFLSLSQCLDSILHAEHKTILEEMRCYYDDLTPDDFPPVTNGDSEHEEDETDSNSKLSLPFGFTLDFNSLFDFSSSDDERNYIKASRTAIPGHFQRSLMRLLKNAEFEELSPRDLMLTSALNTDYLLTLPIYVDWKRASMSSVIVFR